MLIPVLFHSFTQASPSPIASLLLSAPSFMGDIYNIGVPEQFQTLFGSPPPFGLPSRPPPPPQGMVLGPSINLFIFRRKSLIRKRPATRTPTRIGSIGT
ncbi:hypothetical protein KM043_009641 [Ampulex compressa]|nr:hypothetical protein KM043_009641 [Ampulex compressa]